jgi:O-antigen ligase
LSREAYLALLVGLVLLSFFFLKNNRYFRIIPIALGFLSLFQIMPSYFYERLSSINIYGGISRIVMWKTILKSSINDLILGVGTGSIGSYGLNVVWLKETGYAVTDNVYLRFLVEAGILGLLLFIMICICIGRDIFVNFKMMKRREEKTITLFTLLVFSSLLITSFFSESILSWLVCPIFWLLAGYVGYNISLTKKRFLIWGNN